MQERPAPGAPARPINNYPCTLTVLPNAHDAYFSVVVDLPV